MQLPQRATSAGKHRKRQRKIARRSWRLLSGRRVLRYIRLFPMRRSFPVSFRRPRDLLKGPVAEQKLTYNGQATRTVYS